MNDEIKTHGEPVAWIRFCSDGCFEGPIMNSRIEDVRKEFWTPLYAIPEGGQIVRIEPLEQLREYSIASDDYCYGTLSTRIVRECLDAAILSAAPKHPEASE